MVTISRSLGRNLDLEDIVDKVHENKECQFSQRSNSFASFSIQWYNIVYKSIHTKKVDRFRESLSKQIRMRMRMRIVISHLMIQISLR